MRLLLVTPPLTQLNTPYPATPFLTGFARRCGLDVVQADPGLTWVLRLLSRASVFAMANELRNAPLKTQRTPAVAHLLAHTATIASQIEPVIAFLQNRDLSLAHRIVGRRFLVEGPRSASLGPVGHEAEYLDWAFGTLGIVDRARHLATLFVDELADAITAGIDPHFGFARYGESLAVSAPTLDPLLDELAESQRFTVRVLDEVTRELVAHHSPNVIGMSLPFPGNVLGALRMAQTIRAVGPDIKIVWGGGYVSTELRALRDPRLFDYVDAVVYDHGEQPLERLVAYFGGVEATRLVRTRLRVDGKVTWFSTDETPDIAQRDTGTPTYRGLSLHDYPALLEVPNAMHRLWTDTRWNKLLVARGCYWRRCSFCDVTLPYIRDYEQLRAHTLVDQIEALVAETGQRGFHFVDEAAPPAALKALAEEILRRELSIVWWTNVRFEKTFTPELCALLARSGCIAVTGGLETASDRLLTLMRKGVTVAQVARVCQALGAAGIRVHAYLMYGFPTETTQETIDSLERVRQLFAGGCLDSAFWHRFALTIHSPMAKDPTSFGIRLLDATTPPFAQNEIAYEETKRRATMDLDRLGAGLHKAIYNYMRGLGLDDDVRVWFEGRVPKTTVAPDLVRQALASGR